MKKILLSSAFVSVLSLGSALNATASTTGTLFLQGVIPAKLALTVTPEPVASALDFSLPQTDLLVASVNERSNSKTGYKVNIVSTNESNLKSPDSTDLLPYTVKYDGNAIALNSPTGETITNSVTHSVNVNKDVSISYNVAAPELLTEGNYSDTLIFTISAN